MQRPLTPQEPTQARQLWPKMNVSAVVVTDNPTPRYNCLAWTLGITTYWLWPWVQSTVTKADFDALYRGNGFTPSGSGPIAVFGLSPQAMTHGSISGPRHGHRWESKCGAWIRIQHGLAEMEGGVLYGDVLGFYSPASGSPDPQQVSERLTAMKPDKLSKADLKFIKDRVEQLSPVLRERFEKSYAKWKEAWNHPLLAVSSNPATRTQTPSFLELIALGPAILPLLMDKLARPDDFFALQAVDRLLRPQFIVSREPGDPAALLGDQGRAVETVKQWIRTVA